MFDIMNGASKPGFPPPAPSQQPGQFGQPAPFGQPGQFGQPAPFGQPDEAQQASQSSQPGQFPQAGFPQPGHTPPPAQMGGYNGPDDGDYDHYNADGNGSGFGRNMSRRDGFDAVREGLDGDIGGAVMGVALGFAGRAFAKRMKKAYDEKIAPAMAARAAQVQQQTQQQSEQSRAEQDAIVARYPELRGCMTDRLIFLDGGYKTVPLSDLTMPITLAQADAVVTRLR
jgi:hypothetical protein